ncbi:MAG: peptidylprolyl isomerase [Erysipelotrichaceae bacterium]|nr:peptidylprolyl isomerase [Erysipelotrichaceae bacterium]
MKRLLKAIVVALCFCTLLTGCKDATATVSNPNELIVQIGKEKITKKDLYDRMMKDDATNSIISKAMEIITAAEIETTPALEAKAQELFESYKAQLETQGDFEEVLKNLGYESVDAFKQYCLTNVKADELAEKYITDGWDEIWKEFAPVKAKMIFVDASEIGNEEGRKKAEEAIAAIKAGKTFEEVAAEYSSKEDLAKETLYTRDNSTLDYNVLAYLATVQNPTLSDVIVNKAANGYYVVQVTVTNQEQLKQDLITYLKSLTTFTDKAYGFFYKKHNFKVYDIDVYNTIKNNYPSYLGIDK